MSGSRPGHLLSREGIEGSGKSTQARRLHAELERAGRRVVARDGLARARGRNRREALGHESRFEDEEIALHERVRAGYLESAARAPDRIRVVDASRREDEVFRDVLSIARQALEEL